ncbi:hypothetical protein P6709_14265 [Jeotgalibacillus sp. ET6]|uniref:hypothetical protein n=1 Tax=Jeotgalibacillus sp. ET6 TaxID=3037260 RepID=UPI00241845F3|nr:hypothetical protein [Jeotgalibacillus sp. ET6]MDG5472914.1 hypothetical protein [Jeotgalibacillus sp. ET6]
MRNEKGNTYFMPTGIKISYTHVDLSKKQVTAIISCYNDVQITLIADLTLNQVNKNGSFEKVFAVLPDRDEELYFEEVNAWAKIFIEHKITYPKKYFDSFI